MSNHPDVIVIGGGIIGLTSAYYLAGAGFTVEVVDRSDLGREASWAGAGMIPPGRPDRATTPADQLRAIGSVHFPAFSAELRDRTGIDNGYLRCGAVEFLEPADEYVLPLWEAEEIRFDRLSTAELARIEPAVIARGGVPYLLPDCAQVRNPWHLRALIAGCEQRGVRLRPQSPVRGLIHQGTQIGGVTLGDDQSVSAGAVLIAAGAWSEPLLAQLGHRPDIHPVRGQIALLRPAEPVLGRILVLGKEYLVPRGDGRVLIGSTEEPEAGFEKANTTVAIEHLTALAGRIVPSLSAAPLEKCWSGLRPASRDGLPFIGPVPGHQNVFVATGHFRAGVQLSVGTAQLVAEMMCNKATSVSPDAFRLDREQRPGARPAFRS